MLHIRRTKLSQPVAIPRVRRVPRVSAKEGKPRYFVDFDLPWGRLFQLYLMTSFLYYRLNRSVISNDEYDHLCKILYNGWRTARHKHKHLVTREDLLVVTGFRIKYPLIVEHAALRFLDDYAEV